MKFRVVFCIAWTVSGCAMIPVQNLHSVKKGETVERIAKRYQISRDRLAELNGWADLSRHLPEDEIISLSEARGSLKATPEIVKATYTISPVNSFIWPIHGRVTSRFGIRWGAPHNGIDISARKGSPIKASAPGRIIYSGTEPGYGKLVIIYHGAGYSTIYAHASKLIAKKGEKVKRGQIVALIGSTGRSTGPHLHFEIRKRKDPVNPQIFLP